MSLFVFNNQQKLIKSIPNRDLISVVQDQALNVSDTLFVEMPADIWSNLKEPASYLAVQDPYERFIYHMYKVSKHTTKADTTDVEAIQIGYDELKAYGYIKDRRFNNRPVLEAATAIVDGTDWQLGYVDTDLPNINTNFYYISRLEALSKLIEATGAEVRFRVEISGNKIIAKRLDLYKQLGTFKGKRFAYGSNLLEIIKEEDTSELYTALVGRGKGEETDTGGFGRRITFADIAWSKVSGKPVDKPLGQEFIELPEMTAYYGYPDGEPRTGIVEFGDIEEPEQLLKATYERLVEISRPQVQFKAKVQTTGDMQLGEEVAIIRSDLGFRYKTRVFRVKRDYLNNMFTEVELGDKLTETLASRIKKIDTTNAQREEIIIQYIQTAANSKNKIFRSEIEPTEGMMVNDLWYKPIGNGEMEMYQWNGSIWELIPFGTKAEIEAAIEEIEEAKRQAKLDAEKAFTDAKAHADAEVDRINTALSTDIVGAIELAEQAKQDAIDEAERLVTEQDTIYQEIFEGYDSAVGDLTDSVAEADSKATDALEEAGVSSSLAQTAIDSASRAESTATTANNKAVEAFSKADDAMTKADDMLATIETFEPIVTDAQAKAEEAITKADGIPDTIIDIIVDKGLVSGDWVDTRIDDVTGEINYELTNVKGDIPVVIMGFEWNVVSDPALVRTDYVEDYANLDEYNLKNAEFNLSIDGIKTNITTIEQTKLDTSVYNTFKNNEYVNDVDGIRQRIAHVETNKLDDEEFQSFKEHDYEVTVDGLSGQIQVIEDEKLDSVDFDLFKSNEYQLTVDGFNMGLTSLEGAIPTLILGVEWDLSANPKMERTDYVEEVDPTDYNNPDFVMGIEWNKEPSPVMVRTDGIRESPTLQEYQQKTADYDFTIDGMQSSIESLETTKLDGNTFSLFKSNEYSETVDGINRRIGTVEESKLDGDTFTAFKTNDYQVTVDGFSGEITDIKRDKLDGQEFQDFKSNEYQLTVDGLDMQLTSVSGAIQNIVLGVEWDESESPQMERTDYTEESTSRKEFESFLADYSFRADGWDATNSYITENSTSINSLINNAQGWSQTISYVDENKTKFNETIAQVDSYKQTIGSDAENLAQLVMTDEAFVTRIGGLEDTADWTESQVIQLAESWSMNLKSNGDVVTAINATEAGVRILGASITLDGDTLVTGNFAVAGDHVILDADTQVRGNFRVSGGNVTLDGNTTITDDFTVTGGSIILDGNTTVHNDFTVTGGNVVLDANTRVQGDFTVSGGNVILDGDTVVRGGFTVLGENIVLDANTTVLGTFKVLGGNVTLDGNTTVLGDFSVFGKNIILDGDTTVRGDFTVAGDIVGPGIDADNITVGTLNAANVDIINLNASSIVGLNSEFVQSAWNGISTRISIDATAFTASDSAGNQAIINTSGEIRSTAGGTDQTRGVFHKGRLWFHTTSGSAVLNIGAHPVVGEGVNRGSIATARAEKLVIGRYNDYLNTNPNAQVNPYITLEYGATLGDESNAFTKVWHDLSMSGKFINDVQGVSGYELAVRATSGRLMLGVTGYNTLQVGQANTRSFGNIEMQPGYEVTQASDRRWKDIVGKTETNALEEIKKLSVVDYYWKNGDGEKQFGLIAQDSPFLSVRNEDGYYGISGNKLAMLNLLSVQELYKRIEALEGEIELLKSA